MPPLRLVLAGMLVDQLVLNRSVPVLIVLIDTLVT